MYKLENETEWYFFTPRFKRYTNGSRPGRDAHGGYWKPTETKAPVRDDQHNRTVGFKQTLAFHLGHDRSKDNKKTDWRMHEYTLTKNSNPVPNRRKVSTLRLLSFLYVLLFFFLTWGEKFLLALF